MAKLQITNYQASIIAKKIYDEIKAQVDAKLEARKKKELPAFIAKLKSNTEYKNLVKSEERLLAVVKDSQVIADFAAKHTKYYYPWGSLLCNDKSDKCSTLFLKNKEKEAFKAEYPVTLQQLESDVIISVLGAKDIQTLISEIKSKYIK